MFASVKSDSVPRRRRRRKKGVFQEDKNVGDSGTEVKGWCSSRVDEPLFTLITQTPFAATCQEIGIIKAVCLHRVIADKRGKEGGKKNEVSKIPKLPPGRGLSSSPSTLGGE